MTRAEEQRLIERAAAGDQSAASEFIRAHQKSLFGYLLRLSGRADVAEDICQDAFIRALSNLHRFDPRYRFSTWLFTIAKRLLVNHAQRLKPVYDSEMVGGRTSSAPEPGSGEAARARVDVVQQGLMVLGIEQREIVILFHMLGWPIGLISEHLDMPEGTIKSHLHRARRKMREALEKDEACMRRLEEAWA